MSASTNNPWLHRFAFLTAFCTLLLIGLGGLVTSKGAGMAVPDWPTSYGYNMFALPFKFWTGGAFYEHTHRLWASAVGLLTTVLACWLFGKKSRPILRFLGLLLLAIGFLSLRSKAALVGLYFYIPIGFILFGGSFVWPRCEPSPKWLRRLGVAAFLTVALQGVLGGLRVVLFKDEIGIFHATLAQLFLVLVSAIVLFTSDWWRRFSNLEHVSPSLNLRRFAAFTTCLILFQLILGATMRHQHAGLAVPDFPLAYGKIWPPTDAASIQAINQARLDVNDPNPITAVQIVLHMAHRITAFLIFGSIGILAFEFRRTLGAKTVLSRLSLVWFGMIFTQLILGILTVLKNKPADIATAHVVLGAASLVMGTMIYLIARKISVEGENQIRHPANASSVQPVGHSKTVLTANQ